MKFKFLLGMMSTTVALSHCIDVSAQDQFLDVQFGNAGIAARTVANPAFTRGAGLVAGGKILLVGTCGGNSAGTSNARSCLVRLNSNGSVDESFGNQGLASPQDDGLSDFAFQALEGADGKYLVSGSRQVHPNGHAAVLYRFNANGTRDFGFGVDGRMVNPYNATYKLETYALALDDQARIYLAGSNTQLPSLNNEAAIVRLRADGSADLSWGVDGVARYDFSATQSDTYTGKISLLPNGKVLVGGGITATNVSPGSIVLARYDDHGALDPSFGSAGVFRFDLTQGGLGAAGAQFLEHHLIDSQGRIWLFLSSTIAASAYEGVIMRLTRDGQLDSSFGDNGQRRYRMGDFNTRLRRAIEIYGRIFLAGNYQNTAADSSQFPMAFLVGLQLDGTLDHGFGISGRVNITNHNFGLVQMLERQPETGKLVLSFTRQLSNPNTDAYSATRLNITNLGLGPNAQASSIPFLNRAGIGSLLFLILIGALVQLRSRAELSAQ